MGECLVEVVLAAGRGARVALQPLRLGIPPDAVQSTRYYPENSEKTRRLLQHLDTDTLTNLPQPAAAGHLAATPNRLALDAPGSSAIQTQGPVARRFLAGPHQSHSRTKAGKCHPHH